MIDEEVRKLIDDAYEKTKSLLIEKRPQVEKLAEALLDREVLFQSDVEALIGKRPFSDKKSIHVADEAKAGDNGLGPSAVNNPVPGIEGAQQ
jgi:cell division protease FtsH